MSQDIDDIKAELKKLSEEFELVGNMCGAYRKEEEIYIEKMKTAPNKDNHKGFVEASAKFREATIRSNDIAKKMSDLFMKLEELQKKEDNNENS